LIIVVCGYLFEWKWTGLPKRTLWDWMGLLIIPAVIAGAGLWFNQQQRARELQIAAQRERVDRQLAELDRQDAIMQSYLDQIGQLLLDKDRPLRQSEGRSEMRVLARARTLTALSQLHDGDLKGEVMRFLLEADLITGSREEKRAPVISLQEADLEGVYLEMYDWSGIFLIGAYLKDADISVCGLRDAALAGALLMNADLRESTIDRADLNGANIRGALLGGASLRGALLFGADLTDADLTGADLTSADLTGVGVDLTGVDLTGVDLTEAAPLLRTNLTGADLTGADLTGADLTDAKVTQEQLDKAKSLTGATMPNGQKYEDWLKSKGSGEEEENSGAE
jgi:uncharacterized protein YjbI with pentapeptide repeats